MKALMICLSALVLLTGCAVQKTVTITTRPPDAVVKVNGAERGRGTVIERFTFQNPGDVFYVTASRKGFQDRTVSVTRETVQESLAIELRPHVRRVSITASPPAIFAVDGTPLNAEPASLVSADIEFTVDAQDNWITHTISAERPGYVKAEKVVAWSDNQSSYSLRLESMRKDLRITSNPPGATVTLDGVELGITPLVDRSRAFEIDINTNKWIDKVVKVSKPGYDPVERRISWDAGENDYQIDLIPKQKTITLKTDPAGANVVIEGAEAKVTPEGATANLVFTPINDRGDLRTYKVKVSKKTADAEWYPGEATIAWDGGKTDYVIKLREVLSQPTPATAIRMVRDKGEWKVVAEPVKTTSMKFVTEAEGDQPQQIVKLGKDETVGSISVSPDGTHIVYSVVGGTADEPTSQMFRTRTDGTSGSTGLSDGRSVDLTPAYTAAGDRIVFSSNRAGRKMSIWAISSDGTGGVTRLTTGDTNDLWPSVDAEAKPRLFYQAHIDTRSDPRLYVTQIGTILQTDLTRLGGLMPRVSPKADFVAYVLPNEKNGKRDIYRVGDKGGAAENLTSGDSDNIDPAWNFSGGRLAFSSDRGKDTEDSRNNYDIWVLDVGSSAAPVQITRNGSVDDMPCFDPSGDAVYFRSNRGGTWGIWKINVKR